MHLPLVIILLLGIGSCACQTDENGDDGSDDTTNTTSEIATDSSEFVERLFEELYKNYVKTKLKNDTVLMNDTFAGRAITKRLFLESVINRTAGNTGLSAQDARRMTVIQVTFAIMISVLIVADIFLAWSFSYLVIHYEKRGRMALRYYRTLVSNQ